MEKLLKTRQDADEFLFWVSTLMSEVLPQGFFGLQGSNGNGDYCCLGVGVACVIPEEDLILEGGRMKGGIPADQYKSPRWLKEVNEHFRIKTGNSLVYLNDIGVNHVEIGKLLLKAYADELNYHYEIKLEGRGGERKIILHKIEERTYTRDEVKQIVKDWEEYMYNQSDVYRNAEFYTLDKWFEQNVK